MLSWGEVRTIRGSVDDDSSEEEKGRYFVGQLIKEWNLRPVDAPDGEPLPVPASAAAIDRLPASVYIWLLSQVESPSPNGKAAKRKR